MGQRVLEKKRRRNERVDRDAELVAGEKRARRRAVLGPLLIGVIALAAVTFAGGRGGGEKRAPAAPVSAARTSSAPFGPHYDGLVQRRRAAKVPTMMQTMRSPVHFHPLMKVFIDGKSVPVPANIGIDPRADGMQMAGLHTHDATGTIHVEGVEGATLGQFFAIWGVPLSSRRLGPYRARAQTGVRVWVDGKPSRAFGGLKLADGQGIVVSYGPLQSPPPAA